MSKIVSRHVNIEFFATYKTVLSWLSKNLNDKMKSVEKGHYGLSVLQNLTHLIEHKFLHNFQDIINPISSYSLENESVSHCLLRGHFFIRDRKILLVTI